MKVPFACILAILFVGCQESQHIEKTLMKEFYSNGALKSETVIVDKEKIRKMVFHENGHIKTISFYKNDILHGEQLWFYDNGTLEQKVNYVDGKRQDKAYFFYPSGRIKHSRILKNDIEIMFGADYWDDSLNLMKSSLHFNDSGQIYYKKNFDSNGQLLSEEGHKE